MHTCVLFPQLAKKSLCVKGSTALFKAKMEESFHIFGGFSSGFCNASWEMEEEVM